MVFNGPSEAAVAPVAVLEGGGDAVFASRLVEGEGVPADVIQLTEGTARIRFSLGTIVDITGPAEFRAVSPLELELIYGRVIATVPKASHGFTVRAGDLQIVDLGTVFSAEVEQASGDSSSGQLR